jgi:hypothetical protein
MPTSPFYNSPELTAAIMFRVASRPWLGYVRPSIMQNTGTELDEARKQLCAEKFHPQWDYRTLATHLEQLASLFQRTSSDHRGLIAQFHDCAGKLPFIADRDFGALVLEATAAGIDDRDLRAWLYTEARFRAAWCAQAATAGGESIARSRHIKD